MAEFVLKLNDIDEMGRDYTFPVTARWITGALSDTQIRPGAEAGNLGVRAQKNGGEILVTGGLKADLLVECVRCLADVALPVDADITALYSPADGRAQPREQELQEEDLDRMQFTGNEIALDDLVREQLVLEVPMQPLCSADCEGIQVPQHLRPKPQDFGGEGSVDPRLAPLQALKDKLPKSKE